VSNAEKQPTGHGPEGCDENGPAAALLVGYVSIQICALLAPCRRPILIATKAMLFIGQDTGWLLCDHNWVLKIKPSTFLVTFGAGVNRLSVSSMLDR
jgi:hypothetical protein